MIYKTNKLITEEDLILNPNAIFIIDGDLKLNSIYYSNIKDGYFLPETKDFRIISLNSGYDNVITPNLWKQEYINILNKKFLAIENFIKIGYDIVFCNHNNYINNIELFNEIKNNYIQNFQLKYNFCEEFNFEKVYEYIPHNICLQDYNMYYTLFLDENKVIQTLTNTTLLVTDVKLNNFISVSLVERINPKLFNKLSLLKPNKNMFLSISLIDINNYQYKINGLVYKFVNETDRVLWLLQN
jgi:hypothetical protein